MSKISGDQRERIVKKLFEIGRQVFLQKEYGFDPEKLDELLQRAVEGRFDSQRWREEEEVIYFEVTSDGTTGEQWIKRLEEKGFRVSDYAKSLLLSSDFKPTSGVTYKVAVLPGTLFADSDRITKKICIEAEPRRLAKPNPEVACLTRDKFSDEDLEEMGFWYIVTFHDPIKDSDGDPRLLAVDRVGSGRWLGAGYGNPNFGWLSSTGFALVVSQV